MPQNVHSLPDNSLALVKRLAAHQRSPIVIGGMAVVIHGSDRVTVDTDFIHYDTRTAVEIAYELGFQVITKDAQDEIEAVPTAKAAAMGLMLEKRRFFRIRHTESLEVCDVWIDDRAEYDAMAARAKTVDLEGTGVLVASVDDLIAMKEVAAADRNCSRDRDDLEFLRALKESGTA